MGLEKQVKFLSVEDLEHYRLHTVKSLDLISPF